MAIKRKLARTSKILGLPITKLAAGEVRDHDGRPLATIEDQEHLAAVLERLANRVAAGTARTYRPFITAWWSLCERREAELGDDALLRGWLLAMTRGTHAWSASSARVALAAVTALRGLLDLPAPLANHAFSTWFDGELLRAAQTALTMIASHGRCPDSCDVDVRLLAGERLFVARFLASAHAATGRGSFDLRQRHGQHQVRRLRPGSASRLARATRRGGCSGRAGRC